MATQDRLAEYTKEIVEGIEKRRDDSLAARRAEIAAAPKVEAVKPLEVRQVPDEMSGDRPEQAALRGEGEPITKDDFR